VKVCRQGRRWRTGLAIGALVMALVGCGPPAARSSIGSVAAATTTSSSSTMIQSKRYRPSPPVHVETVLSVDAAPDAETWVAVRARCQSSWCIDLAHSTVGDQRFGPLQPTEVPAASSPVCDGIGCGAGRVLFTTARDGYLYDPGLYSTVDGGRHWAQVSGGTVNALVVDGNHILRGVFDHEGCPGPCNEQIQISGPGRSTWTSQPVPAGLGSATGLVLTSNGTGTVYALGPANLAQGVRGSSQLVRTTDSGRVWSSLGDPCPAGLQVEALAAAGRRVAVLCRGQDGHSAVAISEDRGSTFGSPESGTDRRCRAHRAPRRRNLSRSRTVGWRRSGQLQRRTEATGDEVGPSPDRARRVE
jgi:hypothetical protein